MTTWMPDSATARTALRTRSVIRWSWSRIVPSMSRAARPGTHTSPFRAPARARDRSVIPPRVSRHSDHTSSPRDAMRQRAGERPEPPGPNAAPAPPSASAAPATVHLMGSVDVVQGTALAGALAAALLLFGLIRLGRGGAAPRPARAAAKADGHRPRAAVVVHALKVTDVDARRRQIETAAERLGWATAELVRHHRARPGPQPGAGGAGLRRGRRPGVRRRRHRARRRRGAVPHRRPARPAARRHRQPARTQPRDPAGPARAGARHRALRAATGRSTSAAPRSTSPAATPSRCARPSS